MNLMSSLMEDIKFDIKLVSFSGMWAQIQTQRTDELWQKAGFNEVESQIRMQKKSKTPYARAKKNSKWKNEKSSKSPK